jgi:hypothetical protein
LENLISVKIFFLLRKPKIWPKNSNQNRFVKLTPARQADVLHAGQVDAEGDGHVRVAEPVSGRRVGLGLAQVSILDNSISHENFCEKKSS